MANRIDWYLVELDRNLHRRIPAEQREILVAEIDDHLRSAETDGQSESAIVRLGSPRRLAIALSNAEEKDEPRWVRILAGLCLVLMPLAFLVAMVNHSSNAVMLPWFWGAAGLGACASILILSFRRLRLTPVVIAPFLALILLGAGFALTAFDAGDLDGKTIMVKHEADQLAELVALNAKVLAHVETAATNQKAGKFGPELTVITRVNITQGEVTYESMQTESVARAKEIAKSFGASLSDNVRRAKMAQTFAIATLADLPEARAIPAWRHGVSIVIGSVAAAPGVLLLPIGLNLASLLWRSLSRRTRLPRRRFAS